MQRSGSHGNAVKSAFLIMIMIIMTQVGYLDMINSPTTGNDSFDEESSVMETGSSGSSQSNFTSSAEGADLTVGQAMANITFQYNTSAASGSGSSSGGMINVTSCLLYTSPSTRDGLLSRMPSSA